MKSQFAGMNFGMDFEEEKTLVINNNSSIIKNLITLKDNESKKEQVELICNQIVDIALLSNKELSPSELDELIKRNNKLMEQFNIYIEYKKIVENIKISMIFLF